MPLLSPTTTKAYNLLAISFTQTRSKSDTELNTKLEETNNYLNDNEIITTPSRFDLREKFKFSSKTDINDTNCNKQSSYSSSYSKNSKFLNKDIKK
jgi:hypothetical protein